MKNKLWITQAPTKDDNVIVVSIDLAHLPSQTHKWGAINNKAQRFEDKRKKPPKYKTIEW